MFAKKVLVVDDDQDLLRGLNVRLRANGYRVLFAVDAISAVSVAKKEEPDVIILDLGLPGGDGFIVMERLKGIFSAAPVIILTARDPIDNEGRALEAGAKSFFQKPVDNDVLLAAIKEALEA